MHDFLYFWFLEWNYLKFINETGGGLAWYRLMYFSRPFHLFPECHYCVDYLDLQERILIHSQINQEICLLLQTNIYI